MRELFPEMDDKNKVLEELNCSSRYSQTRIEKKKLGVKFKTTDFLRERISMCIAERRERDRYF